MIKIVKLNESKIKLVDLDYDIALSINNYFKFYVDNYMFTPKYKAGIWDGTISLFDIKKSVLPFGLLPNLIFYLKKNNYDYVLDESIKLIDFNHITDDYIVNLTNKYKCTHEIRDYQINAVKTLLKKNKCISVLPTGSGKSYCMYIYVQTLLEHFPEWKILIIVPTIGLVEQMEYDFHDYDRNNEEYSIKEHTHKIYSGKEKTNRKKITISTWQSLQNIEDLSFFKEFDAVLVDECHTATAKIITDILQEKCINAKMKAGLSGSLHDKKINEVQLNALFGEITKSVTTKELIERDYLSKIEIKMLIFKYSLEESKTVCSLDYHTEQKYITKHIPRFKKIIKIFKKINNNNSLILFKNIGYGTALFDVLQKTYTDRPIYYVAGSTDANTRESIRKITDTHKNAIIVASMQVFSTGINIPSLKYLILAQPYKSKIKIIQSIGRTLRKNEVKDKAIIIDIVDDFSYKSKKNYSLKHAVERLKIYKADQFPVSSIEVQVEENNALANRPKT